MLELQQILTMKSIHLRFLWKNQQANSYYNQDKVELHTMIINIPNQYMEFLVSGYFLPSALYFLKKSCCQPIKARLLFWLNSGS